MTGEVHDGLAGGVAAADHEDVFTTAQGRFACGSPYSNGCDIERIWEEAVYLALPSSHPFSEKKSVALGEIANEPFVVSSAAPGPEIHDFIIKRLSQLGSSPRVRFLDVGRETLMAMVGLGAGVSLVSGAEVGVAYPDVVFIPICGERLPFSVIWSPANDNPALRTFLSAARLRARRTGKSGATDLESAADLGYAVM